MSKTDRLAHLNMHTRPYKYFINFNLNKQPCHNISFSTYNSNCIRLIYPCQRHPHSCANMSGALYSGWEEF